MSNVYDEAGQELRSSRLYVAPDAEPELDDNDIAFDSGDQDDVRDHLGSAASPVYVAILPEAAASPDGDNQLYQATGSPGTYLALFSGSGQFEVGSTIKDSDAVITAARDAFSQADNNLVSFFTDFADRVEDLPNASDGTAGANGSEGDDGGSGLIPLGILAVAGGGGFLLYRRNKRNRERAEVEPVRAAIDEDVTAYGEELAELDLDVRTPDAAPADAQREYARALDIYESAKSAAERIERPSEIQPVTSALDEGRWLLACVRARLAGEEPPQRRLPCFFDPRHGPSVEDVLWAPPGGTERDVPACAADAVRIKDGLDPDMRLVPVGGGERRPYWDAGPAYAGWAGGYYGGFLPGMLWGTVLGSSIGWGGGWGDSGAAEGGAGSDGGGWGDGGGFGGGGFDGGGFDGGGFDGGGW
jgi:hypothetical protein